MAARGLRARLALRAALLSALSLAAVAVAVDFALVRPMLAATDEELRQRVDGLAAVVAEGGEDGFRRQAPGWVRAGRDEFAALRGAGGGLLASTGRSVPEGAERLPPGRIEGAADPVSGEFRVLALPVEAPGGRALVVVGGISADDARRRQSEIRLVVIAAALGGVLLVGAGAWFGAALVLAPLRALTEAARTGDAERGEVRLPVRARGDEFDDLARLLNDLLARVAGALEEERRFAGEAAHELRAPLSILRLRVEEALAAGKAEEMRAALESALGDVDRVNRLVQALLELSRAAPAAAPAGPEDAAAVLAALAEDFRTLGSARGVSFAFAPPPSPAPVLAPREVVETVVSVLVDNAFRYTPAGGSVAAEVHLEEGRVRIRVRDTGPGVAAEEAGRVFDRLFRGKAGRASGAGFGLGLALARRLARSAGGDVVLENPGAAGASFAVTLPAA